MTGFEPATYASQTQRSTRLSYTPMGALCRIESPPDWRDKRGGFALASAAVGDVWLGHGLVFGWFFSRDVMRAMPRPWAQRGGSPFCAVIGLAALPSVSKCLKSIVKDGW